MMSGLAPYIAGAAVIAFTLDSCAQPSGTGLNASGRISLQSETAQPLYIVDRSHKGDRLPGGQPTYGLTASGDVAIGNMELRPAKAPRGDAPRSSSFLPELPDGCESAFSSLTAAKQKTLAARCLT
jgi:hypothetical protein